MWGLCVVVCVGIALRVLCFAVTDPDVVMNNVMLSNPTVSFPQLLEGHFLRYAHPNTLSYPKHGHLHISPLLLPIPQWLGTWHRGDVGMIPLAFATRAVYIAMDVLIAIMVYRIAISAHIVHSPTKLPHTPTHAPTATHEIATTCAMLYLLNPLTALSCASLNTSIFHTLALASAIAASSLKRGSVLTGALLGIAVSLSPHSLALVPFLIADIRARFKLSTSHTVRMGVALCLATLVSLACLLSLGHQIAGDWEFLGEVYGFNLSVRDKSPGLSLYWYMGLLMFREFEGCFEFLLQYQALVFAPAFLVSSMRIHTSLGLLLMLGSITVFRPYPCVGDMCFYIPLLFRFKHLATYMHGTFYVGAVLLFSTVLSPVMWRIWVSSCAGNPNYLFAITLCIMFAQVFLICDLLQAQSRTDFEMTKKVDTHKTD